MYYPESYSPQDPIDFGKVAMDVASFFDRRKVLGQEEKRLNNAPHIFRITDLYAASNRGFTPLEDMAVNDPRGFHLASVEYKQYMDNIYPLERYLQTYFLNNETERCVDSIDFLPLIVRAAKYDRKKENAVPESQVIIRADGYRDPTMWVETDEELFESQKWRWTGENTWRKWYSFSSSDLAHRFQIELVQSDKLLTDNHSRILV